MSLQLNSEGNWNIYGNNITSYSSNNLILSPDLSLGIVKSNGSAFQVPSGVSGERPLVGEAGMIRYDETSNLIEYYNSSSASWLAISQQPPQVFSISPQFVPEDNSDNFVITGQNFNATSSVSFIGNVDSIEYAPFGGTSYVTSSQLEARNTLVMSDASNNTGFFVKVVNTDAGLSNTTGSAILSLNNGPYWVTNADTNLGTGFSGVTYTRNDTPFTDLSALDTNPSDLPVIFRYTTGGSPSGAAGILLDPSGILYGGVTLTSSASTTFDFTSIIEDSAIPPAFGADRRFFFTVALPTATVTGGTSTIGYTDASGEGYRASPPYENGYTVYVITAGSGVSFQTPSIFPPYVTYLVVGGGGAGGGADANGSGGGGGGAGGYLAGYFQANSSATYTISVGDGGTGVSGLNGNNGGNSVISGPGLVTITAVGGGGGAHNFTTGSSGGSGGGGGLRNSSAGGVGTFGQGNAGGIALVNNTGGTGRGGGGGSPLAIGLQGTGHSFPYSAAISIGGMGANGIVNHIRGTGSVYYAGGGGGGTYDRAEAAGGLGGGGTGGSGGSGLGTGVDVGGAGTANTGGGGGGSTNGSSAPTAPGGQGGSGIVILRHLSSYYNSVETEFTINGTVYSGSPISGTYVTAPGYNTGTNTTAGTATVTYVDSDGLNPRSFASGPYTNGYTVVTFLTTTPVSPFTNGSPRPVPQQVLYYGNYTSFTFEASGNFPAAVDYLVVGGGGTGAKGTGAETYGGGGGAGEALVGVKGITSGVAYDIFVGSGGVMDPNGTSGSPVAGGDTVYYNLTTNGVDTVALGITASGGQGGNGGTNVVTSHNPAGSSGVGGTSGNGYVGGVNTPNGANGMNPGGGGGGSAGVGRPPNPAYTNSGGNGIASSITGTYTGYACGGGGGGDSGTNFNGGTTPAGVVLGGRGGGSGAPTLIPTAGTANTGSGGGGMRADDVGAGGGGGTGIVVLRFPSYLC